MNFMAICFILSSYEYDWEVEKLHVESSSDENVHGNSRPINQAPFSRECIQKHIYENFIKP